MVPENGPLCLLSSPVQLLLLLLMIIDVLIPWNLGLRHLDTPKDDGETVVEAYQQHDISIVLPHQANVPSQ